FFSPTRRPPPSPPFPYTTLFRSIHCPSASTVAILREAPTGFEVLMVQRHAKSRFMADRFVYPGGKLDPADCTPRAAQRIDGRSRSEEHTSELQSRENLVCRLLLE